MHHCALMRWSSNLQCSRKRKGGSGAELIRHVCVDASGFGSGFNRPPCHPPRGPVCHRYDQQARLSAVVRWRGSSMIRRGVMGGAKGRYSGAMVQWCGVERCNSVVQRCNGAMSMSCRLQRCGTAAQCCSGAVLSSAVVRYSGAMVRRCIVQVV